MIGRRFTGAVCLLCALGVLAAQSASAQLATTAVTCRKGTGIGATFRFEHCTPGEGTGEFGHFAIANGTKTEITAGNAKTNLGTNGSTPSFFHLSLLGIELELKAETVVAVGFMENGEQSVINEKEPVMLAHGTGTITFEGVTVVKPEFGVCAVEGAKVVTKELTGTTFGQGMGLKIQPREGSTLAVFKITGASCPAGVLGDYVVSGSLVVTPEGSTLTATRAGSTAQGTLKTRNKVAGLDSKLTISGREFGAGGAYTPLSATT